MINSKRIVDTFLEYVQIDSESMSEKAVCDRVASDLEALGCEVYIDNAGEKAGAQCGNLHAVLKGDESLEPVLLSAHMDTVKPGIGVKPIIEDGVIMSDKTTVLGGDDKSGIVAVVEALRVIKENALPHPTIEVVFTICEEIGLLGSVYMDYSRISAKKAAVLDSSGDAGKIIMQAPGQIKIEADIVGRSAHAGIAPEQGISAIMVAAEAVHNMRLLRIDEETTANIGTFKAEGATNIVAERVHFVAEARSRSNEKLEEQGRHMMKCLTDACEKFGATLEGGLRKSYEAYKIEESDPFIAELKDACSRAGVTPTLASSGGGSDANNMNLNGIKAVVLGTGMDKVHTVQEQITIENLENIAKLVLAIATK